jgi:hypothetical protein
MDRLHGVPESLFASTVEVVDEAGNPVPVILVLATGDVAWRLLDLLMDELKARTEGVVN